MKCATCTPDPIVLLMRAMIIQTGACLRWAHLGSNYGEISVQTRCIYWMQGVGLLIAPPAWHRATPTLATAVPPAPALAQLELGWLATHLSLSLSLCLSVSLCLAVFALHLDRSVQIAQLASPQAPGTARLARRCRCTLPRPQCRCSLPPIARSGGLRVSSSQCTHSLAVGSSTASLAPPKRTHHHLFCQLRLRLY